MLPRCSIVFCLLALVDSGRAGVSVEIHHLWEGKALTLPTEEITIKSGEKIDLTRLAYLLSEPRFLRRGNNDSSGDWLPRKNWFAFVDGAKGLANLQLGVLPEGSYTALQFHVGLDKATDAADPSQYPANHPLNPVRNNLHWSPQGGYIFLALEGHLRNGEAGGYAYHLGNSGNRMTVTIPASLELRGNTTLVLDFHLDRLFNAEPALEVAEQSSTHSRPDDPVAATLKSRVQSAFTFRALRRQGVITTKGDPVPAHQLVGTPYKFRVARGFPIPKLPTDFPLTEERVGLGRSLFSDNLLSRNNTQSCSSCHQKAHAFSDANRFSQGTSGRLGTRNSMPLFNLAWKENFFWDGRAPSLREQALQPIQNPIEMHETLPHVIEELEQSPTYPDLFKQAFGTEAITAERIGIAIEQFLLTKTSYDSRFDRAANGKAQLTDQEKRGFELFMTEHDPRRGLKGADCFHCHGGPLFTDHRFHNNGLKDEKDLGLSAITKKKSDNNRFITPSLRNIALTAPYMHDGRFQTLEKVVEHYDSGLHRSPTLDPNLAKHPRPGLGLSDEDKAALVAFLKTLTDPQFRGN